MTEKAVAHSIDSSEHQIQVAATTAANLLDWDGTCCRALEINAAGTLAYTDPHGNDITLTALLPGQRMIAAQAILATTSVAVVVYY
jgi:hypothetical protein